MKISKSNIERERDCRRKSLNGAPHRIRSRFKFSGRTSGRSKGK